MKKQLCLLTFVCIFSSIGMSVTAQDKQKGESVITLTKEDQQKKIAAIEEQIELNKNNSEYDMKAKKEELKHYENAVIIKEEDK